MNKIFIILISLTFINCKQSNAAYVKKLQERKTRDSITNLVKIKDSLKINAIIPYKKVHIYDHENNSGAWVVWNELMRMSNNTLIAQIKGARYRSNRRNWKVIKTNDGWDQRFYQQNGYYQSVLFFNKKEAQEYLEEQLFAQRIEYNTAIWILHNRKNK